MSAKYHSSSAVSNSATLRQYERYLIVMLVVLGHVMLLRAWFILPGAAKSAQHQLLLRIEMESPPPESVTPPESVSRSEFSLHAESKPVKHEPIKPTLIQETLESVNEEVSSPPLPVLSDTPNSTGVSGLPDREPDYRAAYLNNPQPDYPMMARRMGWQGKVVLKVEVLLNGLPGQVLVEQSSGRNILDSAALQAVLGWRFIAARQGGQAVTKWFLVPITFTLEGAA